MKRVAEIDIAKAIGIVLVVVAHTFGAGFLALKFYCMPIYFFLGGLLFAEDDGFGTLVKKSVVRLYIPFLTYEFIYLILSPFFLRIGFLSPYVENVFSLREKILHILLLDNVSMLLSPFWFVTSFFFSKYLIWGICRIIKAVSHGRDDANIQWLYGIVSLGLIYIGLAMGRYDILVVPRSYNFAYTIGVTIEAAGYGIMGVFFTSKTDFVHDKALKSKKQFIFLMYLCLILFERINRPIADMRLNDYTYPLLQPFFAFVGIMAVLLISEYLYKGLTALGLKRLTSLLVFAGKHSFTIMALHPLSIKLVGLIQVYCLKMDREQLADWNLVSYEPLWLGIYFLAGITIPILLAFFWEKAIIRLRKGGTK